MKVVLSALLVCGSVFAEVTSIGFNGLSGLADENAASLMKLTDKECMRWEGGFCYGLVVDEDDSNPVEVEIAENWVNRTEVVE